MRMLRRIALLNMVMATTVAAAPLPEALEIEVTARVAAAHQAGLPGERLRIKAQEGVAKGVPHQRILAVLDALRQQLDNAAALLAKDKVPADKRGPLIAAVAAATQAGVPADGITALTKAARDTRGNTTVLLAAVLALTDLVAAGHRPEDALRLVELAVLRGLNERDLGALVRAVDDLRGRVEPQFALQAIYTTLAEGGQPPWWMAPAGSSSASPGGTSLPGTDKGPSGLPIPDLPIRR